MKHDIHVQLVERLPDNLYFFPDIPRIAELTLTLLREESPCQQVESDCDADDSDVDHDEVLMDAVSDLLPAFAKIMGPNFEPIFAKLFDPLMKFTVGVACLFQSSSLKKSVNMH